MSDCKVVIDAKGVASVMSKAQKALELTAHVLRDDIREEMVIPRKIGNLQGEAFHITVKKNVAELHNTTPYARRLYFHPEYNFHKAPWQRGKDHGDGNPNAQAYWFKPWQKGGKYQKRPAQIFEALLKKDI